MCSLRGESRRVLWADDSHPERTDEAPFFNLCRDVVCPSATTPLNLALLTIVLVLFLMGR
jgi:hypothetical protein